MQLCEFCVAKTASLYSLSFIECKLAQGSLNHETLVCLSHCSTQRFVTCAKKLYVILVRSRTTHTLGY